MSNTVNRKNTTNTVKTGNMQTNLKVKKRQRQYQGSQQGGFSGFGGGGNGGDYPIFFESMFSRSNGGGRRSAQYKGQDFNLNCTLI
jgi:curved DNA-binding protein